ncbi:protein PAL OF QUIRKY [Cryptomeria japonica]|uniref:protein PAL OF QUIRKY n=1 Tax=Cryptomeria japonica TaxID=3369 RepID=UPI0027DA08AB|nr:protein PAL OF QUIRKY [Cryptomeria japonica]
MEASGVGVASPQTEDLGGNKFKFLCSYGGQILPRPGDGNLRYVGGETRVVAVSKNATFQDIMNKLENMCGAKVVTKYQLPIEDLDLLVSVTCDEDLQNMKEEYERYESLCCKESCPLLRIFLFPSKQILADHSGENQTLEQRYIDAVNGIVIPSKLKFSDYSFSVDPNRPTEMDVDSSAPSTARTNYGSFQTDHPHHLSQALQEVDLNRRHTDHFTTKCKSMPKDRTGVCTQSKPMIQVDQVGLNIVVSNPSSPP